MSSNQIMLTPAEAEIMYALFDQPNIHNCEWQICAPVSPAFPSRLQRHNDAVQGLVLKGLIKVEGNYWHVYRGSISSAKRWLAAHLTAISKR